MPFDDRAATALRALAHERDAFRSAIAATLEQVRALMAAANHGDAAHARIATELGAFAAGRIHPERFAEIARADRRFKKSRLSSIRHAQQMLTATLSLGDHLHYVEVEPNGDCVRTIEDALATAGRAFAAAYTIELIRAGRDDHPDEQTLLAPMAPDRWTRAERLVAPPLVVRVHGNDLRVSGLEDLLQGNQKVILLVEGVAPPAALARLISPGLFVMQCRLLDDLQRLTASQAPGVAAVMTESAAVFTYERGTLEVSELPAELPRRPLRTSTVFRQRDDVAWLVELQKLYGVAREAAPAEMVEAVEPGDKLAAWLLKQIEIPET